MDPPFVIMVVGLVRRCVRIITRTFGARAFLTFLARRALKVVSWNVKTFLDLILVSFGNTHLPDGLVCVLETTFF